MENVDLNRYLCSLIEFAKDNADHNAVDYLTSALQEQGLEYKNGEIIKTQRRVAAEAKEAIFDNEDENIRYYIINFVKINDGVNLPPDYAKKALAWLEKQKPLPEGCVRKQVAEAKEALYTAEVETGDGGIKAVVTKEVSIKSEDGAIRKELINTINLAYDCGIAITKENRDKYLAWIEKQGEQKSIWHNEDEEPQRGSLILLIMQSGTPVVAKVIEPNHTFNHGERWAYIDDLLEKQGEHSIFDVPSREVILAIWQLGNDWKELTDGVICTEYGTQLDYIQKHWQESEYYLRSKQGK